MKFWTSLALGLWLPVLMSMGHLSAQSIISVSPASLELGDIDLNTCSEPAYFTVSNTGTAPLVGEATVSAPFEIVSGSPYNIPPGGSASVGVRACLDGTEGQIDETVSFSGGGGTQADVTVYGHCEYSAWPDWNSEFSITRAVGDTFRSTVTITCTGTCPVNFSIGGTDSHIRISPDYGYLSPGESVVCDVMILSDPLCKFRIGTYLDSVYFHASRPFEPPTIFYIHETVIAPYPPCAPVSLSTFRGTNLDDLDTLCAGEHAALGLSLCDCPGCDAICSPQTSWYYSDAAVGGWKLIAVGGTLQFHEWKVPPFAGNLYLRAEATDWFGNDFSKTLGPFVVSPTCPICCAGTTGEIDGQGIIDLSDLSLLILYLTGRASLPCPDEANVNGKEIIDLSDLSLLIAYLTVIPAPSLPNCP